MRGEPGLLAFSERVGRPLTPWQAESLDPLVARVTAIVAPRQSGKSRSLAVLAAHWAFRRPGQRVLVVSAGEDAARRLLGEVRAVVTGSPLLRGSVVDDQAQLVVLSNGSEIRSVPASERQVGGWTVDLLLVDEAALVADDLLLGAAIPTTAARPEARIVLASSATAASGAFFDHVMAGRQGAQHVRAHAWRLVDATWIAPGVIEAARESMTEARFAAEYLGEFASGADAMFPRALLDRAMADVRVPGFDGLVAATGLLGGQDWGATTDRSALAALGRLRVPRGMWVVVCAHAWRSGHPLDGDGGVIGDLVDRAAAFESIAAESNGLGLPLVQELDRRVAARFRRELVRPRIEAVHTSQGLKAAAYSALRLALEQGRVLLPASAAELRRELLLLRVELSQGGGERIEAGVGHDDIADALMLAAGPYQRRDGEWRTRLRDMLDSESLDTDDAWATGRDTVTTGAGVIVPRVPWLVAAGVSGVGRPTSVPSPLSSPKGFRAAVAEQRRARRPRPLPPPPAIPAEPAVEQVGGFLIDRSKTTNRRRTP